MADIGQLISRERRAVAAWLESLPDTLWSRPSLCDRWNVLEVVGHLTFPWQVSTPRLLAQIVRARGYPEASARDAARLASVGPTALIADIRANADNHRFPLGAHLEDLLAEVVLHPLDIAVPNEGVSWTPSPEAVGVMLAFMTTHKKGRAYHPEGGIDGVRFEATDRDWSFGSGPAVRGNGVDLLLAVTARPTMEPLAGEGADRFPPVTPPTS